MPPPGRDRAVFLSAAPAVMRRRDHRRAFARYAETSIPPRCRRYRVEAGFPYGDELFRDVAQIHQRSCGEADALDTRRDRLVRLELFAAPVSRRAKIRRRDADNRYHRSGELVAEPASEDFSRISAGRSSGSRPGVSCGARHGRVLRPQAAQELGEDHRAFRPGAVAGLRIDVAGVAGIDEQ